jgi:flavin reductase (DIM6/NTAB) family NADH-FMN oxidoreductase RutF
MSHAQPAKPARSPLEPQAALAAALRSCLGRFVTGVAVVSYDGADGPHGITVNAFTSVSMEPPLILVSIAKTARSHAALSPGIPFTVNVLGAEQEAIARQFSRGAGELAVRWLEGSSPPRLLGTLAHFQCAPWRSYDAGDHTLLLGEVVNFDSREGDALGFFTSRFMAVAELRLGHEELI